MRWMFSVYKLVSKADIKRFMGHFLPTTCLSNKEDANIQETIMRVAAIRTNSQRRHMSPDSISPLARNRFPPEMIDINLA